DALLEPLELEIQVLHRSLPVVALRRLNHCNESATRCSWRLMQTPCLSADPGFGPRRHDAWGQHSALARTIFRSMNRSDAASLWCGLAARVARMHRPARYS